MEELLSANTFSSFSLENYYFTDQSIVVAAVNYLKSLNQKCEFLGLDLNKKPILNINNFNYQLNYISNLIGLISFDSLSFKRLNEEVVLDKSSELSNTIFDKLNNYYD